MFRPILTFIILLVFATPVHAQQKEGEARNTEETFEALITAVKPIACDDASNDCYEWSLIGTSGGMNAKTFTISTKSEDGIGTTTPHYAQGDRVIVQSQNMNGEQNFILSDIVRRAPLFWLFILFAFLVWIFGGIHSLRSFAGMLASLGVIFIYILPRILAGDSPVVIALTGSALIMALTFILGHGWNKKMLCAFIGTSGSLIITAILSWIFSNAAQLTGLADEETYYLLSEYPALDVRGILLAAIIIGTLGVLDDITIAQSSAVFELRGANPRWSARQLYQSACRIGSDHIAAAVNTLILAYAGTALPLLLLFAGVPSGETWWTFLNREVIATEIVRTLVGSIGLLAAVPLTTFIASWWAVRTDHHTLPSSSQHHH